MTPEQSAAWNETKGLALGEDNDDPEPDPDDDSWREWDRDRLDDR